MAGRDKCCATGSAAKGLKLPYLSAENLAVSCVSDMFSPSPFLFVGQVQPWDWELAPIVPHPVKVITRQILTKVQCKLSVLGPRVCPAV